MCSSLYCTERIWLSWTCEVACSDAQLASSDRERLLERTEAEDGGECGHNQGYSVYGIAMLVRNINVAFDVCCMCINDLAHQELAADMSVPMSFYAAYDVIVHHLPRDAVVVNEGSSTMDIGRTVIPAFLPKHRWSVGMERGSPCCHRACVCLNVNMYVATNAHQTHAHTFARTHTYLCFSLSRLDAGTFATMGLGCGYAIAASLIVRDSSHKETGLKGQVFCIQGDSAFGFSGMELEVACRYREYRLSSSTFCFHSKSVNSLLIPISIFPFSLDSPVP